MNDKETEILRLLARSWNNLDTRYIENHLDENVIYDSQWALLPITGKSTFIAYLLSKFDAIKAAQRSESMKILAELATVPSLNNRGAVILSQITKDHIRIVTILTEVKLDKITHIHSCFIPNPAEVSFTGETPI